MEKRTILTEEQLNHIPKDVLIAMYVQLSETMNRVAEQNTQLLQQVLNLEEKIDILTQRYYGRKTEKHRRLTACSFPLILMQIMR